MELVFWVSIAVLAYTYVGYPMLMAVLGRVRPRPVRRQAIRPTVSLLIVAHNEARWIEAKLRNSLGLEYPRDRREIVVALDGSTDGTTEIARGHEAEGVTVIGFETQRGKPSVLNDVIPKLRGEIVVLSDARQLYDRAALVALVENFTDPCVGAVSGELILTNEAGAAVGEGVGLYWRYEKLIRRQESHHGSTVGATGAIYAIRRDLFEPIPADTLLDDVIIPMRIARRGYRVVFEAGAKAFDQAAATARQEFARKVRTISGNFQMFVRERWLLNPFKNRLWFQTVSHKAVRLLAPGFLLCAFGANVALLDGVLYLMSFAGQVLFYAAAILGYLRRNRRSPGGRWLSGPYVFCLLNFITVMSFYTFITKRQAVTWTKA